MDSKKNYIRVERHKWPDEIAAEKKRTRKRFAIIASCIVFFFAGFGLSSLTNGNLTFSKSSTTEVSDSEKFNEIYDIMKNQWYFGKDIENLSSFLIDNAIQGLISNEYDAHTNYLEAETASQFMQKLEGSMVGVGIEYTTIYDEPMITKVFIDSPAEKSGLKEGDIVKKINGIELKEKSSTEISSLAKGEEGTVATFEIERNGKKKTFDITRASISMTVYGYEKQNTAILELTSFSERSHEEVESYLTKFKKNGYHDLVIDLRDNSGGYLSTAINIASFFMEEGSVVIKEENRDGSLVEYKTKNSTHFNFDHVVILVNENTASASEALTACLKEQIGATVVGVNTYGKGTVQQPKVFSDGSYFKYTTAEWLTPSGEKINKKGIQPDIEVKLDEARTYRFQEDDQQYQMDSVGDNVKTAQIYLNFLGYQVDRKDGYYSNETLAAVKQYQEEQNQEVDGIIDNDLVMSLLSSTQREWSMNEEQYDVQLKKAIEVAHGN